jgi:hypothetical protein
MSVNSSTKAPVFKACLLISKAFEQCQVVFAFALSIYLARIFRMQVGIDEALYKIASMWIFQWLGLLSHAAYTSTPRRC